MSGPGYAAAMNRWGWLVPLFLLLGACWVTQQEIQEKLDETTRGDDTGDTGDTGR